ncbi:protein NRT1/ PTR FAMILY 6.1 isoform X2 [Malania oleifera]|uniref:protein NRT1/ PTR FAMILY 6.1 isoform X2 n=1 Tax=Malania oleifera TaxID=397392 RepID=UPI0025AE9763|nr:protein NRT1/ PTR FAMILY 6.1 isoform X2 [Malania oleifera]XP_057950249.1 protein NRT1/ PTR FAMILY 6.1 isoform X2 [Malania oleifera]
MGTREIKSPEDLPKTPAANLDGSSESFRRKKLGIYFIESDDVRTAFGGGYSGGTTPVNIHGKPITDLSRTGGWIAAFFIFGITLCGTMNVLVPNQDQCDKLSLLLGNCEPAKPWQMLYLYTVLYITGFGAAGIRPCVSSFGADQFDERSRDYKAHLDRFFNFFYLSVTIGAIVAFTAVVYIQRQYGWGPAFGALAIAMGISNTIFFIGTPLYRHRLPGGSPLTRVAQVLIAAFRKRHASFSSSELVGLYEVPGKRSAIKGSGKIAHTNDFRCLDKAALQLKGEGVNPSPWRLCTVTQVEEVKILLKLIPIPACTITLSLILTEFLTLSVQQAYTLNTSIGHLKLPVTCMPVFPGLSIFLILSLYYLIFVPLFRCITGHPHGASQLQRVGIGLAVSILSVAWAGIFERYRRNYALEHGYEASFLTPMTELSAYWLLIQYCLIGIAEVFCIVGLLEFLYEEAPDAMRSIGSAYAAVAGGLGCFAATILNNIVKSITGNPGDMRPSWLSQNINTGKFDYFYWLLMVLSLINFCGFLYSAHRYKYRKEQGFEIGKEVATNQITNPSVNS